MAEATKTETDAEKIVRLEARVKELEKLVDDLEDAEFCDSSHDECADFETMELFADPHNWKETEDKEFIWKPFMNSTERDPVTLATNALK